MIKNNCHVENVVMIIIEHLQIDQISELKKVVDLPLDKPN